MTAPALPPLPDCGARVLGVGLDLVHVPGVVEQLAVPGTVFAERAFTARERREARRRAETSRSHEAEHLAARWAAKEAFVKAWSTAVNALTGRVCPPVLRIEEVDWRGIEVVNDRWGRPSLRLGDAVAGAVEASLGEGADRPGRWPVSLTHDGGWAAAVVLALTG
ncbi:holo-ACP synthase AcpS [Actinomyces israelii]|uniref:holo-ACP synthase AcpS n=1 Tax=Actinomyces israelii TaxID=1659 RepID=UPI0025534C63|nr:holo-ACP synthase [Actinomyces israelii]WKR21728.1 Holo-[acyl-carrier-protein] synthase [Actinomyces israelii]